MDPNQINYSHNYGVYQPGVQMQPVPIVMVPMASVVSPLIVQTMYKAIRFAKVVKWICLIDGLFLALSIFLGGWPLILPLLFDIIGFFGARNYSKVLTIIYLCYLILLLGSRILVLFLMDKRGYVMVMLIIVIITLLLIGLTFTFLRTLFILNSDSLNALRGYNEVMPRVAFNPVAYPQAPPPAYPGTEAMQAK